MKTFYVTFTEEIDELLEGQADLSSGLLTEKQAERVAKLYLEENPHLSGLVATFHNKRMYDTGDYGEAEEFSLLYS